MSKHNDLDGKILTLLADGPMNWHDIHNKINDRSFTWRTTDRRLQSLRRAGLIIPVRVNGRPMWSLK
jgi:DNA-binding PadR family transcriptional regulator